jgi:4-amino-4-deoxy-L-arabinose transferase-like glycosyltransferase
MLEVVSSPMAVRPLLMQPTARILSYPRQRGMARAGWQFGQSPTWLPSVLAVFALAWITLLVSTSATPPADNIEQMVWVQSLQWGYYKHPPFPTWLYWVAVQLFGSRPSTSYLVATLLNLSSLTIFWLLVRKLRSRRFAQIALLAVLGITYYNARFTTLNHNTVLMLVSAISAALCWKACTTHHLRWWLALGVALGVGLLTKYQIAVTMVCVLAFWLTQRGWRDARQRLGLLSAALIALIMFVPHLQWLRSHDFGPIGYAMDSALGAALTPAERLLDVANWLADQLLNRAFAAWLLLIVVAWWHGRTRGPDPLRGAAEVPVRDAQRAFLLCWGLVPLLFMPVMGLAAGSHLHLPWGTPYLLFAVPAVMELTAGRVNWSAVPMREATRAFLLIQAVLLGLSFATSYRGPAALRDTHWRNFDSQALVRQLEPALREALHGQAVAFVAGPQNLAGALALQLPERPSVLIDGPMERNPWLDPARVAAGPTLRIGEGPPPAGATTIGGAFAPFWWRLARPTTSTVSRRWAEVAGSLLPPPL